MTPKRLAYWYYAAGMYCTQGMVIKYRQVYGPYNRVYLLEARFSVLLTSAVNFAFFNVLNSFDWEMTASDAASYNPELQPGESLFLFDTGVTYTNTADSPKKYSQFVEIAPTSGKFLNAAFVGGANNLAQVNLNNGFQSQKPESSTATTVITAAFYLEVLNAPDDFSGFLKIENKTAFAGVRASYPVVSIANPKVYLIAPPNVTVTATYDGSDGTGNYYSAPGANAAFFYLEFSRTGSGNLVITRYPDNVTP